MPKHNFNFHLSFSITQLLCRYHFRQTADPASEICVASQKSPKKIVNHLQTFFGNRFRPCAQSTLAARALLNVNKIFMFNLFTFVNGLGSSVITLEIMHAKHELAASSGENFARKFRDFDTKWNAKMPKQQYFGPTDEAHGDCYCADDFVTSVHHQKSRIGNTFRVHKHKILISLIVFEGSESVERAKANF